MKTVAILTMVYDDDLYLRIWLSYWERFVPRSSLYILIHANYENYENIAKGCNTIRIARPPLHVDSERNRWKMLSRIASGLTYMFDRVIYTDVDEIIALDPNKGSNPIDYIFSREELVISPFGLDVVDSPEHNLPPIELSKPILSQRRFVAPAPSYDKPCIVSREISWGSGGHESDVKDIFLSDSLFLFHLRLFDKSHYRTRSLGRKALVTDAETGQQIQGLGGPTWHQPVEYSEFRIEAREPVKNLEFGRFRRRWLEEPRVDRRGFWKRKGGIHKKLYAIPQRFEGVF